METIVTFVGCHPTVYGLVVRRTVVGVEVVSPRPIQRRGVDSLIDIDVSVARTFRRCGNGVDFQRAGPLRSQCEIAH